MLRLKGLSISETIYVTETVLIQILNLKRITVNIACLSVIIAWLKIDPNLFNEHLKLRETFLSSWMNSFKNYGKDRECQSVCRNFLAAAPSYSPTVLKLIESNILVDDNDFNGPSMKHVQSLLESLLSFIQDAEVMDQLNRDPECQAILRLWPSKLKKNMEHHFNLEGICDLVAVSIERELLRGSNSGHPSS